MSAASTLEKLQAAYPGKILFGYPELARAISSTPGSLRARVCRGEIKIKSINIGTRRLFPIESVAQFIDEQMKGGRHE